jgi:DNA-binding MarR family transcriptional regulator
MKESKIYLELHRALASLLMKNRFIRKLTHTGLSRAEVHILIEIQARGESTVKILQQLLNMDQSSISRLVMNLVKRGLVKTVSSKADRRTKLLNLTAEGIKTIDQIDQVAGAVFETFASRLSKVERSELLVFFKSIADWYGQPGCPTREGESDVRMEQRRMSRALGVLSQNIFASELSSSQWFVFREIAYSAYPLNPKTLSERQGIAQNSLSIVLEKLEGLKYIKRDQALHDSRYIELTVTEFGKRRLNLMENKSAEDLACIFKSFSKKEAEQLLKIVLRYIGQDTTTELSAFPANFTLKKILQSKERNRARAFAFVELVQRGHAEFAPSRMLAEGSYVFGLFDRDEKLQAICEIYPHSLPAELSLLASNKETSPSLAYLFMSRVFEALQATGEISELKITFEPAIKLLKKAGILKGQAQINLSERALA